MIRCQLIVDGAVSDCMGRKLGTKYPPSVAINEEMREVGTIWSADWGQKEDSGYSNNALLVLFDRCW